MSLRDVLLCAAVVVSLPAVAACSSDPPNVDEACAGCKDDVLRQVCEEGYHHCEKTAGCDVREFAENEAAAICSR